MSTDDVRVLAVANFEISKTREGLWKNFLVLCDHLKRIGLKCEIWIDGSFLTQKIDPDDVDFVVNFPVDVLDNANPSQVDLISKIYKQEFVTDNLHTFVMYTAPAFDFRHAESVQLKDQWKRDFGFSYVKREPKGIAVIEVTP